MPLAMRDKVFITVALTGSGSTQDRSDKVPRSPEQIATAAIDAAKAGAAVVHCHVRDPETGAPDRAVRLYREVVERRVFTVTGERPTEEQVETMIESGESEAIFQKAILEQGRGQVMDTVAEIHERREAVQEIEQLSLIHISEPTRQEAIA